jgi:curved DNA-binding protein CbpA
VSVDPYRTLGLEPGAPMAEVKRAYRRLAKAFHPDSAGEAALPRFLAIHEAYEAIRTGRPAPSARGAAANAAASAGEPWRADPARARAARERARSPRGRPWGGATAAPGSGAGTSGSARTSRGPSTSGTSGAAGGARRSGRRKETRKATLGSTSYDDARDAADATWSGASWYGPTTGEYWIVNPREYADPRKHGPAYQSRAWRAQAEGGPAPDLDAAETAGTIEPEDTPRETRSEGTPDGGPAADHSAGARQRTPGRTWDQVDPAVPDVRHHAGSGEAISKERHPGEAGVGSLPSLAQTREWLGGPADDPIRRLGVALVAWPPIGLAAAAAIGELTGCSSFSAACGGTDSLLPWLAQAGILGLLLLLPPFARLLSAGTIAVVLALVPVTAFLVVLGGTGAPQAGFAMAFLLGAVWLAGVAWSLVMSRRRARVAPGMNGR